MNGRTRPQSPVRRARGRWLASTSALCTGLCVLAAAPALAATPEEADQLRADIEAFLLDPNSGSAMEWMGEAFSFRNGTVSVEAAGDSYEILIPQLVVIYDAPASTFRYGEPPHVEITLGDLHATMTPDPVSADLSKVAAHFGDGGPVTIIVEPRGEDGAKIDIGRHELDGVWSEAIGYFVDGGFAFHDVVATSTEDHGGSQPDHSVSIGLLSSNSDLTEVQPGLWDGRADLVLENLVAAERGEPVLSLDRFALYETIAGFAFDDYMTFLETYPIMSGQPPEGTSDEEAAELLRDAVINFPTILDDFSIGWTLDGLNVSEDEPVVIGHHEFELGISGLAGDMSDWHLRTQVSDVTVPPDPQTPPQFVPMLIDLDLNFTDVPTGLAWQAVERSVATTPLESMDDIGPMLGQELLGLVMQAQTGMTLGGEIDWQVGNVTMDGEVHADPASPMMVGGSLAIVAREMQDFIREVESTMGPEAASGMTIVQSLGQQEDGDQGPETVFRFVIDGSNVLMNGQDLEPIIMMLSR